MYHYYTQQVRMGANCVFPDSHYYKPLTCRYELGSLKQLQPEATGDSIQINSQKKEYVP
jgi:hypothetical protein